MWKAKVTAEEKDELRPLLQKIRRLRDKGLNGAAVIATFVRRRVQPLRIRGFPMNSYEGKDDATREVVEIELSDREVAQRVGRLLEGDVTDEMTKGPQPLNKDHPTLVSWPPLACVIRVRRVDRIGSWIGVKDLVVVVAAVLSGAAPESRDVVETSAAGVSPAKKKKVVRDDALQV